MQCPALFIAAGSVQAGLFARERWIAIARPMDFYALKVLLVEIIAYLKSTRMKTKA